MILNGWKKESNSNKDFLFSDAKSGFLKIANNSSNDYSIPELTPLSNQGSSSTCVANATADSLEILQGIKFGTCDQISRLFIYWNARVYTNDTNKDEGTFIRNAFDSIQKIGTCLESTWQFDLNKIFLQPNLWAYKQASDNKISEFYKINAEGTERADLVEISIRSNHPVVFGTAVSQNFINFSSGIGTWDPPTKIVGNHAMVITGIRMNSSNQREFKIRNSWGNWGESGHAWLSEKYITSYLSSDFWVPTLMDRLI